MNKNKITIYVGTALILLSFGMSSCRSGKGLAGSSTGNLSEKDSRKAEYLFLEANRLKNIDRMDAAYELYGRVLDIDSTNAAALSEMGVLSMQLNDLGKAYRLFEKATQVSPGNYWYNMMFANLAQNMDQSQKAIEIYTRLIPAHPEKPELNYMLAEVYVQSGEIEKAIDALDRLEDSMGMIESLSLQKYKLYKTIEDNPKAFAEIEKLVKAYPQDVRYQILLGDIYLEADRNAEALAAYEKAAALDPENGYLFVSKATYYDKTGDKESAEKLIKAALVNDKIDVDTKLKILANYLSTLIQRKGDIEQSYGLFDVLMEQHPQEVELYKLYADFLISQKDFTRAKEQLEVAVDLAPTQPEYWMQLMGLAMNSENFEEMIMIGQRAISYLPELADLYFYSGIAYGQVKKYDEAIDVLEKGVKLVDEENTRLISDFYAQLGDIYHMSGNSQMAYDTYDKSLKYNSKNGGVLNNYSYFLSQEKRDLEKAERMIGDAIKQEPNNSTYLDTYAWVFFQQGNYTLARFYLQSALNNGGEKSPEIVEHYGDILYKLGDTEEAVVQWKRSEELGNSSEVLKKKIETKKYQEQ